MMDVFHMVYLPGQCPLVAIGSTRNMQKDRSVSTYLITLDKQGNDHGNTSISIFDGVGWVKHII